MVERILEAYVNVARYEPFRGGSYNPLPPKLKNKKGDHQRPKPRQPVFEMGATCGVISTNGWEKVKRTSSYSTEDRFNFTGIDFPTPV